jgi:hypothetical protein
LAFVKQKLKDAGVDVIFDGDKAKQLQRLGGRASDLESVSLTTNFLEHHIYEKVDDTQSP